MSTLETFKSRLKLNRELTASLDRQHMEILKDMLSAAINASGLRIGQVVVRNAVGSKWFIRSFEVTWSGSLLLNCECAALANGKTPDRSISATLAVEAVTPCD